METKNYRIEDLSTLGGTHRSNQIISHQNQEIALGEINFTLADVIKTIPPECFHKNPRKAWTGALISFLLIVLGYCGMAILPWYWLPLVWIWTGIALTGFFMLGHDCGHYTFAKKPWVNDLAGHLFMTPVFYPFYNWRIQHNCHHAHTNKLGGEGLKQLEDISNGKADPYWHPFRVELYESLPPKTRWIYQKLKGGFWWLITILGWWYQITLDTSKLSTKDRSKVKLSIAISLAFAGIVLPTLVLTTGIWGLIKFWLAPWLMFHFWFSTITLLHHTSPETIWKENTEWNAVQAQLWGTTQCNYPRWFEFFCHDINYHIPHHVSAAIPFYNLRLAHQSLQQNWKPFIREVNFSWSLIKQIISQCHLYNATEKRYQSVKEVQQQSSVKHLT
ncbi:fatty acid desaturase [Scytonema sp. NUACC21]